MIEIYRCTVCGHIEEIDGAVGVCSECGSQSLVFIAPKRADWDNPQGITHREFKEIYGDMEVEC